MQTRLSILTAFSLGACAPDPGPAPVRTDAEAPAAAPADAISAARLRMVEEQIRARGVADSAVLAARRAVPRHRFVPGAPAAAA